MKTPTTPDRINRNLLEVPASWARSSRWPTGQHAPNIFRRLIRFLSSAPCGLIRWLAITGFAVVAIGSFGGHAMAAIPTSAASGPGEVAMTVTAPRAAATPEVATRPGVTAAVPGQPAMSTRMANPGADRAGGHAAQVVATAATVATDGRAMANHAPVSPIRPIETAGVLTPAVPGQGPSPAPPPPSAPTPPAPSATPPVQAPPPSSPPPGTAPADPEEPSWISQAVSGALEWVLRNTVMDGLNPLLALMGRTVLSTPTPDSLPHLVELWEGTRTIAVSAYVLLVMVSALVVMAYHTLQTHHSLRDAIPRVLIGFLASNFSLLIVSTAIEISNALAAGVLGDGVNPTQAATAMREMVMGSGLMTGGVDSGGLWLVIVVACLLIMIIFLLVGYGVRVALLANLMVAAPLVLATHALPAPLDRLAAWWWRAFGALLGAQLAQSLAFAVALRVFFTPGAFRFDDGLTQPLMSLFLAIGVVVVIVAVPFWTLSAAKLGQGGSMLGRLVKTYLVMKTFGLVKGRVLGKPGAGPRRPSTNTRGPRRSGSSGAKPSTRHRAPGAAGGAPASNAHRKPNPPGSGARSRVGRAFGRLRRNRDVRAGRGRAGVAHAGQWARMDPTRTATTARPGRSGGSARMPIGARPAQPAPRTPKTTKQPARSTPYRASDSASGGSRNLAQPLAGTPRRHAPAPAGLAARRATGQPTQRVRRRTTGDQRRR